MDFIEKRQKINEETQKTKLREKNDELLLKNFDSLARNFITLISNQPKPDKKIRSSDPNKAYLGFEGLLLNPSIVNDTQFPEGTTGILVIRVDSGSLAEIAGLRGGVKMMNIDGENIPVGGDIIIKVDGLDLRKSEDLLLYIEQYHVAGQKISFRIIRDGRELDLIL